MKIDDIIKTLTNIKDTYGNLNAMISFSVINEYGCKNTYTQSIDNIDFGNYYKTQDGKIENIKFVDFKTDSNIKLLQDKN